MNFSSMNIQRKVIFIIALIGVISVFLPWITISIMGMGESTNGFRGSGIVVFLAFAASAVIAVIGDQEKKLDKQMWFAALVAGAIAFLFVIISFGSSGESMGFVESGYGIGIWIALISSIGVLASVWFLKNPENNLKGSIDSFRISPLSSASRTGTTNISELEKLIELKNQGKISEEEYQQLKSKII